MAIAELTPSRKLVLLKLLSLGTGAFLIVGGIWAILSIMLGGGGGFVYFVGFNVASTTTLIVQTILIGTAFGGLFSLVPIFLKSIVPKTKFGMCYGICIIFMVLGNTVFSKIKIDAMPAHGVIDGDSGAVIAHGDYALSYRPESSASF